MQLNEKLHICLLALACRHPEHVVDINEAVLGTQTLGAKGWIASDLIELLRRTSPDLLEAPARLVIDPQKSEIYLVGLSEEPAIQIHCRGKLPDCLGDVAKRETVPLVAF